MIENDGSKISSAPENVGAQNFQHDGVSQRLFDEVHQMCQPGAGSQILRIGANVAVDAAIGGWAGSYIPVVGTAFGGAIGAIMGFQNGLESLHNQEKACQFDKLKNVIKTIDH